MTISFWIAGKHTVISAIKNQKRKILKVLVSNKENEILIKNHLLLHKKSANINFASNTEIIKLLNNKEIAHQGIIALIEKIEPINEKDIIENLNNFPEATVVVLDNLTDQRNIGSIIRSSVAFYVDAVFILKKNYNFNNESMYKSASGGMEHIPIVPVVNLSNTINSLKQNNFWIVGLDGKGDVDLIKFKWPLKVAIVVGSEGKGLRRLTKENCDNLGKIDTNPVIDSLNASNAVASCLTLRLRQKKSPEK